ncbi:MAG: hypothetical protein ACI9JM_000489 [Halioglobus sp.]
MQFLTWKYKNGLVQAKPLKKRYEMINWINKVAPTTMLAVTAMMASSPSWANLINNGEFENQVVPGGWMHLQDTADGWQESDIELWSSGFNGVTSYSGTQHAELNSHGGSASAFEIFQTFDTTASTEYIFSFAYRARSNTDEAFLVSLFDGAVGGNEILAMLMTDHTTDGWSTYESTFIAAGNTTTLDFLSVIPESRTVGNFLDAVSVTAAPLPPVDEPIPAPGSLALLFVGLLGLSRFAGTRIRGKTRSIK